MESKFKGRRFSKREITETPDGGELVRINLDDHFTKGAIERHIEVAKGILVAAGVDVDGILADSQHGSMVRDYVLNYLGKEPDSRVGLAAQILEHCLHVEAYQTIDGGLRLLPGATYKLGRLLMLFQAYEIDEPTRSANAANSRKPRRNDVTKKDLEIYRDRHVYEKGTERGWKKAACLDFDVDIKTLNKRMME